jgi:hypothetical protein
MKSIFDKDFYPTPPEVIETMLASETIAGKVILEPSAGSGNIVSWLQHNGAAEVIACEKDEDFAKLLANKCRLLANDFFTVKAEHVSHIDAIYMNPPFSSDSRHILHAWNIAPDGCRIVSLCKSKSASDRFYGTWSELNTIINEYGNMVELGECFSNAERKTDVEVAMITLIKPGGNYETEFDGFFLEEDPAEQQANAIMPYNFIRDIVNRYVGAVKIYDEQLTSALKLNEMLGSFYGHNLAFQCTQNGIPKLRNEFKKELQKSAWRFVFNKMDLTRNTTQGLSESINKFVEQNQQIPFTMRNIYRMLDIVFATTEQRMDKALLEVFERATKHYSENRFNLEGWKTNSQYLLNEKFILPNLCGTDKWHKGSHIQASYGSYFGLVEDMVKALCYISGDNWKQFGSLQDHIRYPYKLHFDGQVKYFRDDIHYGGALEGKKKLEDEGKKVILEHSEPLYGQLFTWAYFEIRAYKKGTMHFRFKDRDLWARFNQRIAKLLGYPLPEAMKPADRAKAKPSAAPPQQAAKHTPDSPEVWRITLSEFIKPYRAKMDEHYSTLNAWKRESEASKTRGYKASQALETAKLTHKLLVKKAFNEGLPVPVEVLADYPELIKTPVVCLGEVPEIELEEDTADDNELIEVFNNPDQLSIF